MFFKVTILPTLNQVTQLFTISFLEDFIKIQGKHINFAEFSQQKWYYGGKCYGEKSVEALERAFETADFPTRLPDALILWWNQWRDNIKPEREIRDDLEKIKTLLEKVTSQSAFLY